MAEIAERDWDIPLNGLQERFATPEVPGINNIKFPPIVSRFEIMYIENRRIAHRDQADLDT
ncbi:hypothetical protein QEZ52_09620 [Aliisedimentitalea scapharcae]|uniref:Uncharacterized protein n=1 Tax=Aliisedimentitalea scapharcae TaxID=1524259 RepID=A0ABZ2XXE1_9RHOB